MYKLVCRDVKGVLLFFFQIITVILCLRRVKVILERESLKLGGCTRLIPQLKLHLLLILLIFALEDLKNNPTGHELYDISEKPLLSYRC